VEVKRRRRDPLPASPGGLALCYGLPERFVGFPARMRTPHLPFGFPVLGASPFQGQKVSAPVGPSDLLPTQGCSTAIVLTEP
jgi:hypothetical protein